MERPTKRKLVAGSDSDDEIAIVSEKFVKDSTPRGAEDDDDDDVVFVKETRASSSTPEWAAPSVNEYIAIRDGTIPKILGRTARLKRPERKVSTPKLSSPRVASIAEYTRAMDLLNSDDSDDYDEEEEEEEGYRRKRTTKRRLDYDDSSDDDYYGRRKKRKQLKPQRKTRSASAANYSNLSPKTRHAQNIDRSPCSVLVENLGGNRKAGMAKRKRTARKRLVWDETRDRRKNGKHEQHEIPHGKLPPRIAAVATYVNEVLKAVDVGDIDQVVDEEVKAFVSSGGTTWRLKSWSDFEESSEESDVDEYRTGKWSHLRKSADKRSTYFAKQRLEEHLINRSVANEREGAKLVAPPSRVASIAEYARARMKYRRTPSVSMGSSSSRRKEPRKVSYRKRFRRIDDSDDFSNTESEELFIRRVTAMERDEAQLAELPPGVASINEYVGANMKYRRTRVYDDEDSSEESVEYRKKKRRANLRGKRASWGRYRRFEDTEEL